MGGHLIEHTFDSQGSRVGVCLTVSEPGAPAPAWLEAHPPVLLDERQRRRERTCDGRTVARHRAIYHAMLELDCGMREDDAGMRAGGLNAFRLMKEALV